MPNVSSLRAILKYFKSIWGALLSITLVFPTAAAFLKVPLVSESCLVSLYSAVGTTVDLIALLTVITFRSSLSEASLVRRVVILTLSAALLMFFVFIQIKTSFLTTTQKAIVSLRTMCELRRIAGRSLMVSWKP